MVKCYICGADINFCGWAMHVKKEKRIHGEDIFKRLKAEREGKPYPEEINFPVIKRVNNTIYDYMEE